MNEAAEVLIWLSLHRAKRCLDPAERSDQHSYYCLDAGDPLSLCSRRMHLATSFRGLSL